MLDPTIKPRSQAEDIRKIATDLGYPTDWIWAWDNYKPMIVELSRSLNLRRHVEIGAGRDPLFLMHEALTHGFDVTLSDISARELSLAPEGYEKVECDIAAPDAIDKLGREAYDLAYCRMVMEHVPDVAAMWRNVCGALAPGGVAMSFFPTLYAPPYVLNRMIPERASRWILHTFLPDRHDDGDNPKFPAYYDHCFSDEARIGPMLKEAGFSDWVILPFWGYSYFWKFPGLKQLDAAFTNLAQRRQWRTLSSFAYVIAIK